MPLERDPIPVLTSRREVIGLPRRTHAAVKARASPATTREKHLSALRAGSRGCCRFSQCSRRCFEFASLSRRARKGRVRGRHLKSRGLGFPSSSCTAGRELRCSRASTFRPWTAGYGGHPSDQWLRRRLSSTDAGRSPPSQAAAMRPCSRVASGVLSPLPALSPFGSPGMALGCRARAGRAGRRKSSRDETGSLAHRPHPLLSPSRGGEASEVRPADEHGAAVILAAEPDRPRRA